MGTDSSRRSPASSLPTILTALTIVAVVLAAGFLGEFSADPVVDGSVAPSVRETIPAPATSAVPEPQVEDGERLEVDGGALFAAVLVLVMAGIALLIRFLLRFRAPDLPEHGDLQRVDLETLPSVTTADDALVTWTEDATRTLESDVDTSHAVIRCWLELERLSATAGVPRRAVQTTSDFASSVSRGLDLPPLPLATLTGLYQRARFGGPRGGQELTSTDRATALSALRTLSAALADRHPESLPGPSRGRRA